jgi:VIT1/CCC1 family predicted Fe2+/Mn2+ transporter
MSIFPSREDLADEHEPAAVAERLKRKHGSRSLSDAVLGGIDGCITTFAIVTGSVGAGFPTHVALILGTANLLADGLSMAVSNYESIKAHNEVIEATRRSEEHHIDRIPEGEREEIRQIFAQRGYKDDALEQIVQVITSDRKLWVDTMMAEEHGLRSLHPNPMKSAFVTFAAFVLIGVIPLLPLLVTPLGMPFQVYASVALAGIVFFAIGTLKNLVLGRPPLKAGLSTLLTGGSAAGLAFLVGYVLRNAFGV